MSPLNPLVAEMVAKLNPALPEDFIERAAIMEFDALLSREYAECLALIDLLHRHPFILTGVSVLQVEVSDTLQCWLTTDLESARQHLADIGGTEMGICGLADVINRQFNGIAGLTAP